jgi:Tfp pilus assembly PilM family ATPase
MSRSNKFSAIQFSGKKMLAVETAHRGNEFELTSITERECSDDYSLLLASLSKEDANLTKTLEEDIKSIREHGDIDAPNISFCLDSRWVFIHSFPLDDNLSEPERADQIDWEFSNYLTASKREHYITGTATLEQLLDRHATLVLTASARRELVFLLRRVTSHLGLQLSVIDVDHFGAEHALRWNYPEIQQEEVCLFGVKSNRIDASRFQNGRPVQYRWGELASGYLSQPLLDQFLTAGSNGNPVAKKAYVYGEQDGAPTLPQLSERHALEVELLNPLRRVSLPHRLRRLDPASTHRYAPAIGLAMRES